MVFRGRRPTGRIASEGEPGDLVTTRILWLDGCAPRNRNTRARYIYIHGTNHERSLGRPASHGCIRMANADVSELFDLTPEGTPVLIGGVHPHSCR